MFQYLPDLLRFADLKTRILFFDPQSG